MCYTDRYIRKDFSMSADWAHDAIVYHVYPLGMCGAPPRNDRHSPPVARLAQLEGWIGHWRSLGMNTVYLGPLLESSTHGYDTIDYFQVDRRLGENGTLASLTEKLHLAGMRVILDALLNHVVREFFAFQVVVRHGADSRYRDWFSGLRFDRRSPLGDPFTYDTWAGAYDLVKLNLQNGEVRHHLLSAVAHWMDVFGIDGLRLDAADVMDLGFLRELAAFCRAKRPDFWLMGEVVHGDYARWANPETLDATTNYEAYKGLYSSLNDRNYHEIAHSLQRQFGSGGVYRGLPLYAFVDNHDVNRIGSTLRHAPHLFPLHVLLFTMPGVPSIYYGSEWAIPGAKAKDSDAPLRPVLREVPLVGQDLAEAISRLSGLRSAMPALRRGAYQPLHVAGEQLVFSREAGGQSVVVALNAAASAVSMDVPVPGRSAGRLVDRLNPGESFEVRDGKARGVMLHPTWGRVLEYVGG
jgi:glycosidase